MKILMEKIFAQQTLAESPPVLLDIGASGGTPTQWEPIAPFSICIAFDADQREFRVDSSQDGPWKKKYLFNRLVAPQASDGVDFHLTRSPYCSSSLIPNRRALEPWAFRDLFDVERTVKMPAVDLRTALQEVGANRIDWYKTDSQGADLRIFKSLPQEMMNSILVAEFEPGILDAYTGEDKLHHLMSFMEKQPFWVSDMTIMGTQRIYPDAIAKENYYQQRSMREFLKKSPGWCEIAYINRLDGTQLTVREYLLCWIFASMKGQHGFALHVASLGKKLFSEGIFEEMMNFSLQRISYSGLRLAYIKLRRFAGIIRKKL